MTKWKGLLVILFVIFCSVYAKEFSASIDGYDRISDITLKLYISANSEYDIWSETHDEIEIVDGEFRIDIGSVNPLIEIDESTTYFVEIYIDGELSGTRRVIDLSDDSSESIFSTESSGGVILEELTPSLEIGDGVDDVIVLDGTDFGIGLATGTDASARLDVRGDDARFWDGSASVGYATGEGDVFIEDALEVDGTIYSSAYRSNDGSALLASELGSPITVTEESNGSWTIGMGSSGTGETYTFSNCGQTGRTGPSQTQANTTYSGTTLDGDVTVTSGIQYWTVPATGTYTISAYGAQGFAADATYLGGQGAYMSGEFNLTSGTVLKILVGQQGVGTIGANGGGGGGSFVTLSDNTPLVIAGGGGGTRETVDQNGCDAITSNYAVGGSGSATTSTCPRKTSSLGQGGIVSASSWGSAGGGLNSNGANDGSYGYGGSSYISGGLGGNYGSGSGSVGGFGCGGSGCGSNGGGGGGGYSGGDGGRVAGGGGSFMSATATLVDSASGARTGHGLVVIESSGGSGGLVENLNDLSDVNTSSPSNGDMLYFDGSEWTNLSAGTSGQFLTMDSSTPQWDDAPSASVVECVNPWDENEHGSLSTTSSYNGYTAGYEFTPSVDGQVTELGFYAYYSGTAQTVYLYNDVTGSLLGSVSVTPTSTGWHYAALATPVDLTAGTRYCVGVYKTTGTGYYRYSLTLPAAYGDITIHNAVYRTSSGWPTSTSGTSMYGLADITFCTSSDPITVSGATEGDIIYYDGSDWTNLGVGTSGQIITTDGTVPQWDDVPSTSVIECVYPWDENEYGSITSTTSYQNYTSGYDFTPSFDGQVTELGFYAYYIGTAQTVYLYNDNTGSLLGSVSVTPTTTGWNYAELSTPIDLTAGTRYCVCVYRTTYYGYYRYSLSFPDTYGDITIHNAAYRSGTGWPTNNNTAYMYCLADIKFCTSSDPISVSGASEGDMIYYDGSDWTNLGVGTSGQIITTDGTIPQWDDAPSSSVVECVNPWDENEHGSLSTTSSYNGYTAGYEFTPSVDGQVTELGFYAYYSGTAQTVYLYNDVTGSLLGTVSVTPTSTGWHYAALATPVDLTAGTRYCVGVYKTTGTGYYRYSLTLPAAYGDITIHNAVYITSSGWPTSTSGTSMYGLADITFCTSSDPISVSGASEGDLIYYDGSEWINLGVGDSAQVLTSNGSEPSWQFPDDGSVTTCVYPWDENEYGSITSTTSYQNYTCGYDFTSSVDGQVTELGFYAYYTGTAQTVYLYNDNTGSLLGSVAVTPTTTGWNYAELSSPINIAAGTRYCVCVYRSTYYGYYRYSLSFPNTYGDITIHNAAYRSGTGWPTSSNTSYMYGLADIKFCKTSGGSGSTETCVNPWNENEYGSINSTTSYQNYTSGYDFTPSVNGQVTELGFYAYYTGTAQTVYLYNDNTGSLLGSVSVTPTTTGWNYAALSTPISLTAGTRYCVCVYRSTYYGYYRYSLSFPDTYGDITIHNAAYRSGTGWPTNNNTAYMYGLADITFCTSDDESGDTDWTGAGSGTMFATDTTDNVAIGSSTATGKLDIRGDEVRVWDGTATVGYADGVGDVFVEDALEVDGTIYGSAYRDNAGGDLINAGTGISVTEESDGSWTVGLGSGSSIGADFYVTSMLATGYGVVDHSSYSGDDRGCIAITEDYYYYTGDTYTVRYNMPNLTSPVSYTRNDGLFSDLSGSGTLYTLWNGSAPPTYSFSSYTVTSIRTMNADLSYGAVTIPLSTSITVSGSASGVYSGYGFAILQTGSNFYLIEIPSGTVTSLGSFSSSRYNAETWANWGIAERNAGVYSVLYRSSIGSIVQRLNLSTGAVTTLATFTNLSDMASITYAPWYNRWYFHHEGTSQFGGSSETAGYANGTHIVTTSSGGGLLIGDLADVDSSSATEGDILYYDGSEWTQLPIGSSGEYLRSDGSIPEWATGTSGGGVIVGDRTFYTTHGPSGGMENANYTYYYRMYYGNAGQGAPYVYSSSSESDDYVMSIPSPEIPDGGSLILDEIEFKFYHSSTVYSYYSVYADNVNWENSTGAPTSTALVNTNWYGSGYRTQTHTIDHEMDSNEAIRITWDNSSSGTNYRFYGVRCKWTIEGIDTGGTGGTGLYSFTNHTFSNCSATGRTGPTLSACRSAYTTAWDDTYLNMTTQGIQEWTVPATGSYRITAAGAAGGRQTYSSGYNGGRGAVISGTFSLTEGETIYILCGQKGEDTRMSADNAAPGGGGGTYVYRSASATYPLIAAGGGGSGARCTSVSGIQDASYTTSGNRSGVLLNGGTSGNGGTTNAGGSSYWAGGGSGWLTDGTGGNVSTNYSYNGSHGDGGRAPRNSGVGGVRYSDGTDEGGDGGFGGGGGGGSDNMGGGGGGGYSGGGGSRSGGCGNEPGGGGGSYNSGTSSSNDGYNTGHGYVTIEKL